MEQTNYVVTDLHVHPCTHANTHSDTHTHRHRLTHSLTHSLTHMWNIIAGENHVFEFLRSDIHTHTHMEHRREQCVRILRSYKTLSNTQVNKIKQVGIMCLNFSEATKAEKLLLAACGDFVVSQQFFYNQKASF